MLQLLTGWINPIRLTMKAKRMKKFEKVFLPLAWCL